MKRGAGLGNALCIFALKAREEADDERVVTDGRGPGAPFDIGLGSDHACLGRHSSGPQMCDFSERVEDFTADRSLGFLLRRAQKLMSQQAEQIFAGRELTLSQWIVLKLIDDGRVATPGEAARMLGHNTGATTRLIDQLESQGLLERRREPGDRRLVSLELTPAGKDMVKAWQGEMVRFFDELLADFSPAEVEMMIGLMSRLVERLEARDPS